MAKEITAGETKENKAEFGWPSMTTIPFVEMSYYDQFDAKVRPRLDVGGAVSSALTVEEADRVKLGWGQPTKLVTAFNFSLQQALVPIPAARPGQILMAIVPPMGVLRMPVECPALRGGLDGSRFSQFYPVAPVGDCSRNHSRTDPTNPSIQLETCRFSGCPSHLAMGWVHSVDQACKFVEAKIGEMLTGREGESSYTPRLEDANKMLLAYQSIDARQVVGQAVSRRMLALNQREQEINRLVADGKTVSGR